MPLKIPESILLQIGERLTEKMGLAFPKDRWVDLERGVLAFASEVRIKTLEQVVYRLLNAPLEREDLEILANHLTIAESYFFRDAKGLQVLENLIEKIKATSKPPYNLRIWSAGCCRGEEPYSIAIALDRLIPDLSEWNIQITATDINANSIKKAMDGCYDEWSFRQAPTWLKTNYFSKAAKGTFEVIPKIRRMVEYVYLNLAEDCYPSFLSNTQNIQLIFCCNVLMYFTADQVKKVLDRFNRCLTADGMLVIAAPESFQLNGSKFDPVEYAGTLVYKTKKSEPAVTQPGIDHNTHTMAPSSKMTTVRTPELTPSSSTNNLKASLEPKELYDLAEKYFNQHDYNACETTLNALLGKPLSSLEIPGQKLMAKILANQGKYQESLKCCEKAIRRNPQNGSLHYLYASILQEDHQIDQAIESLRKAVQFNHDFIMANFMLGSMIRSQGKQSESRKYFQNTIVLMKKKNENEILPDSDGISVSHLLQIVESMLRSEG